MVISEVRSKLISKVRYKLLSKVRSKVSGFPFLSHFSLLQLWLAPPLVTQAFAAFSSSAFLPSPFSSLIPPPGEEGLHSSPPGEEAEGDLW